MRRSLQIDAAQYVIIDALLGETFFISLGTSIRKLRVKNVSPGQLYVFVYKQDHVGGHSVSWGADIRNTTPIDPTPNSTTIQSCIAGTGGILNANLPGTVA